MHRCAAVLMVATLCFGCAADRDARNLAFQALKATVSYEAEVDKKFAAEKGFYRSQSDSIRRYSKRTLLYGRIRVRAERDARLAADAIINSNPPEIMGRVIKYFDDGVKEDQAFILHVVQRQRQLAEEFLAALEKIDRQKARLKAVRDHLATLTTKPETRSQLKQRLAFGKAIREQIKKD